VIGGHRFQTSLLALHAANRGVPLRTAKPEEDAPECVPVRRVPRTFRFIHAKGE